MATVTSENATEFEALKFCIEASDIQLSGYVPRQITTDLGNGQNFAYVRTERDADGDAICWHYAQKFGCIVLHVLND